MDIKASKLMTLHVKVGRPMVVGQTAEGWLSIIPIVGGSFEGQLLRGIVCAGGADWNIVSGSTCHVLARYWLQTNDGEILSITNEGYFSVNHDEQPIRTTPSFSCDMQGKYAFLNGNTYTGELRGGENNIVDITIWKIS